MIIYPNFRSNVCTSAGWDGGFTPVCYTILIDVDGLKGTSRMGKDLFFVGVQETKLAPHSQNKTTAILCPAGTGADCATKYLYEE